jgi:hypothetical protein
MTARLEDLETDALVQRLVGRVAVRINAAQTMNVAAQIAFLDKETELEIGPGGRRWMLRWAMANSTGCPERVTVRSANAHA